MSAPPAIVILGAGNVGTNLLRHMVSCGVPPAQLFNRTLQPARSLGEAFSRPITDHYADIFRDAELYILAVKDDAIATCAASLAEFVPANALVVHCSGATPATVLQPYFKRYGVFYPLQTFSRLRSPDFSEIPICIDAATEADQRILSSLATALHCRYELINDEHRAQVHLAAVFVNNFVNHLYHIAYQLVDDHGIPFELLLPLLRETALRQMPGVDPAVWQTGPAKRNDRITIAQHLTKLSGREDVALLYRLLTEAIKNTHHTHESSRQH